MKRRVLNLLTLVSLLLCTTAAVLWASSHYLCGFFSWGRPDRAAASVAWSKGRLLLCAGTAGSVAQRGFGTGTVPPLSFDGSRALPDFWLSPANYFSGKYGPLTQRTLHVHWAWEGFAAQTTRVSAVQLPVPTGGSPATDRAVHPPLPVAPVYARRLMVPLWSITLATAILPVAAYVRHTQRNERRKSGRCIKCGYDLHATPGKCPQCGTPLPSRPEH